MPKLTLTCSALEKLIHKVFYSSTTLFTCFSSFIFTHWLVGNLWNLRLVENIQLRWWRWLVASVLCSDRFRWIITQGNYVELKFNHKIQNLTWSTMISSFLHNKTARSWWSCTNVQLKLVSSKEIVAISMLNLCLRNQIAGTTTVATCSSFTLQPTRQKAGRRRPLDATSC